MTKNEFMSPGWDKYNPNEIDEIKTLRKIIFHLIREVHVLRETAIQSTKNENTLPKDSLYAQLYKEICIGSYNSAGTSSGEEKILADWFNSGDGLPDEVIMLRKLGYSEHEIVDYLNEIEKVRCYT